jgi:hypothetical protein
MGRMSENFIREGLKGEERHFSGTPFIIFSFTKNYCSNPHLDIKDYGFEFVI